MTDDLKPCPFCGGEPFSFEDYGHSTAWEVGCSNSQCRVEPHVWEKTKDEALASWNTRTPDPSIEALTKERNALRSALNRIRPIPERILRGVPVRDLAETLAEADSALSKGESHE